MNDAQSLQQNFTSSVAEYFREKQGRIAVRQENTLFRMSFCLGFTTNLYDAIRILYDSVGGIGLIRGGIEWPRRGEQGRNRIENHIFLVRPDLIAILVGWHQKEVGY